MVKDEGNVSSGLKFKLSENELGLSENDLGLSENELGLFENELGLSENELGLSGSLLLGLFPAPARKKFGFGLLIRLDSK